jgi:hypothetical protein
LNSLDFPLQTPLTRAHGNRARGIAWLGSARTIVEGRRKVNFADGTQGQLAG